MPQNCEKARSVVGMPPQDDKGFGKGMPPQNDKGYGKGMPPPEKEKGKGKSKGKGKEKGKGREPTR